MPNVCHVQGNEKEHVLTPKDYASCMPLLIGPDENPQADWLHEMLDAGGNVADVITYHLYAGYGLDPSLAKELVTPGFLDFTRIIGGDIARVSCAGNALLAATTRWSPAVLRIGGSEGDDAVYDMGAACSKSRGGSGVPDPAYCMTVPRWNELLHFAEDTGLSVAFGVNVMYGRNCTTRCTPQPCGAGNTGYGTCSPWDPSNAIALMEYTAAHNLSIGGFEV
eukprot:gene15257-5583_t